MDVSGAAKTAEQVVEGIAKVEPTIATIAGMFVPGAAPIVAMVQPWAPVAFTFMERALNDISASNGGDVMGAFIELMNHVTKGQPNSPVLSSTEPSS